MERVTTDYTKVFSEIYEILKYLPKEFIEKLPKQLVSVISENRNIEYVFKYDISKRLIEQDIFEETKEFITSLYLTYYCEQEKKEELLAKMRENTKKLEEEKAQKYNPDKIFENKNEKKENELINEDLKENEKKELTVLKKESFLSKLINMFKGFLKK